LAALLLREVAQRLSVAVGTRVRAISSEQVDGPVEYVFPEAYRTFYGAAFASFQRSLDPSTSPELPLGGSAELKGEDVENGRQPLNEEHYLRILPLITGENDTVQWHGGRWLPVRDQRIGVTFSQLCERVGSVGLASEALDEFIDAGLIRAFDTEVAPGVFERHFVSGGEYNALFASRLRDASRFAMSPPNEAAIEADANELWDTARA
jgi:hypothetical protein